MNSVNNMAATDTLHGIQDLIPLAVPADPGAAIWLTALLLILLALAGWWLWRWRQRPRARAGRQLRRLQRQSRPSRTSAEHARQLASTLARGIGQRHLGRHTPLPAALHQQRPRWQSFTSRLSLACYGKQPKPDDSAALATEACYWLRQWPSAPSGTTQR